MTVISPQGPVEKPLEGVMLDMTEAEYRSAPGLNHSLLKNMDKNPLEFKYQLTAPYSPPTKEMTFGLYAEWLIETGGEGDLTGSKFVVQPDDYSGNAKKWREWKADQIKAGKVIITPDIHEKAFGLLEVIQSRSIWKLISSSKMQVPIFAVFELGGLAVQVKGLLDLYPAEGNIPDVKTSTDCSGEAWANHVLRMFHHTQAAWYLMILTHNGENRGFTHIVLEKEPPFHNKQWDLPEEYIKLGRRTVWGWFERYVQCEKSGEWPSYPDQPEPLPQVYKTRQL